MKTAIAKTKTRGVARRVPRFNVVAAVRCNRCGKVLYSNSGDVTPDNALGVLISAADTWREYGQSGHECA